MIGLDPANRATVAAPVSPADPPERGHDPWLPWIVRPMVLLAAVLLGLGLVAPAMTIETSFGRYDGWLRLLAPEMVREERSTYSLLGGIFELMEHGSVALGLLLLAFSCVFPTLKLMLMAWATETLARNRPAGRLMSLAHHAGKFSMLDVLVVALLILAIKGMPGSSELRLELGVWAFAGSVLLSLVASLLLHRIERTTPTA